MYKNCMFCRARLGRNKVIEHLAEGRALAFDPAKGRLWLICPRCVGWNLVPIEIRWEAIEDCEVLFRHTPRRYSSGNVGLGVAPDGTRLIRVGAPTDREFAAWRYESRFRRRRFLSGARSAVGVAALAGVSGIFGTVATITGSVGVAAYGAVVLWYWARDDHDTLFTVIPGTERLYPVRRRDLQHLTLFPRGQGRAFKVNDLADSVYDSDIPLALGLVLPYLNRKGGKPDEVETAVRTMHEKGGSEGFVASMFERTTLVPRLTRPQLLALEMAAHEQMEATALKGELKGIEFAWRKAEELASIVDGILTPDVAIAQRMRRDLTPVSAE